MKANEIRLGNYLCYHNTSDIGFYLKVDGVDFIDVFNSPDSYDPIPLSPEILDKAGFDYDGYANFTIMMPDNEVSNRKSNARWIRVSFKEYACLNLQEYVDVADFDISAPCKYLHQLQNLYYALTGTELEIKL